jgi:hypothetical protein
LKDSEYKSALVSAAAVMGIDGDRGWKDPLVYFFREKATNKRGIKLE